MIENEPQPVESGRSHNRRGGLFHNLARIARNVTEIIFKNGFTIRNRPGRPVDNDEFLATGLLPYQSIYEMFFNERAKNQNLNGISIGRQGDGLFRNTNTILLEADHSSEIGTAFGYTNGIIRGRISRDGSNDTDRSGLYIFDRGTESPNGRGVVNWLVGTGASGEVRLTYMANKDDNPFTQALFDIYVGPSGITFYQGGLTEVLKVDTDGNIQMPNLPISAPSGSHKLWKDSGTLKIT